jgi:small subunit ribosomal protein S18
MQKKKSSAPPKMRRARKKICYMCANNLRVLNYKDAGILKSYISERGKILPRRLTGTCAKHQRVVTMALKRARAIALLPFSV